MLSVLAIQPRLAKIQELVLDASIDEQHKYTNKVSRFPIEDGSTITDHIINEPVAITMQGFITNTPVLEADSSVARTGYAANRVDTAFEALISIFTKKEIVTIVTGLMTYSNMVLVSLTVPRNKTIGDTLRFTADFQEIKIVTLETVSYEKVKKVYEANKQAAQKVGNGNQTTQEAKSSVAVKALKFIGAIN
jgi:hypothetical protein